MFKKIDAQHNEDKKVVKLPKYILKDVLDEAIVGSRFDESITAELKKLRRRAFRITELTPKEIKLIRKALANYRAFVKGHRGFYVTRKRHGRFLYSRPVCRQENANCKVLELYLKQILLSYHNKFTNSV